MKTDDFDDAIRKKLESIDYAFKKEDIERIHDYVQKNSSFVSFWKRYFQVFFLSANTLVLVASLILNYKQIKEQGAFSKKIETLEKDIAQAKGNSISFKVHDTIIVIRSAQNVFENTQEIASTQRIGYKNIPGSTVQANYDGWLSESDNSWQMKSSKSFSGEKPYLNKQKTSSGRLFANGLNHKEKNEREDLNKNSNAINSASQKGQIDSDSIQQEKNNGYAENYSESTILKSQENSIAYLFKAENKRDSIVADSLVKKVIVEHKDSISSPAIVKKKMHVKNNLSLKNLGYQAGFGIEKANGQIGGSFIGELFVSKRFSINAGIKSLNIAANHYKDENDFYNKRQEKFNTIYAPNLSDNSLSTVSEISMSYNLIQLPVALSYYQPLKKNYSLLFSAGTDFDLYAKFHVRYELGYNDGMGEHENLKYANVFFNNAVLSAGIQKKWNHFNIQLSPFVSPQLKQVDYKKDNLYGGLRVRVFYQFK
jgi:hypothetical protein